MYGWGGSCRGGVGHVGVGGSCRSVVGHVGVGWGGPYRGGVGHVGMGWVMKGWDGMGHVGVRVGWVMNSMGGVGWGGVCHVRVKWGPPFGRHAALWLFHSINIHHNCSIHGSQPTMTEHSFLCG